MTDGERTTLPDPSDLDADAIAGQLICVALRDYAGDADERKAFTGDLERHRWGGLIVFGGDVEAVSALIAEAGERTDVPLLATGDFERGLGQQFPRLGTTFPPPMAFGAAREPALARSAAMAMGGEIRAAGFHVNFAPVADLAVEPANPIVATRAASDDPAVARAYVEATVAGLQESGVAATLKHFPGHGRTTLDSHDALPVVTGDRDFLEPELDPFVAGIEAGAKLVMSAHVAFPGLEPDRAADRPATFSAAIATDLLRGDLGFGGLLCSDALMMGAVAGDDPARAAIRALEAGVDWLLYPPDPPRVRRRLAEAIESGEVDRARVEEATGRLFELKRWAAAGSPPPRWPRTSAEPLAEAVAQAALTARPQEPPPGPAWPDRARWVVVLDGAIGPDDVVFAAELAPAGADGMIVIDAAGDADEARAGIDRARAACRNGAVACAVLSPIRAWKGRPGLSELGRAAVEAVLEAAGEAVLIDCSDPRIVSSLDAPSRVVWTYGEDPASQRAAVAFLRGALPAAGRLPVEL